MICVKLQILTQEFEILNMKLNESLQELISRMMAIIDKMHTFGDNIIDQTIVAKVLGV